ncbi:nucleotide exchange factor GrpE [Buchnera aphidicola]|uniref:Protein GrpE n=1 Tax=Buchnera aphidicola (Cinara cf. splendens/pseudotsugae 3390) TaxID=2518980 RepID=A0A451CWH8_9GAMM|nr:nucleotide exchange factor GrpE [Buchnera aphidicola]VFP77697.1 Protein GrpE [Buchnera aphidicola (Cinara cf. splendens/pseudotsugae 3390)]
MKEKKTIKNKISPQKKEKTNKIDELYKIEQKIFCIKQEKKNVKLRHFADIDNATKKNIQEVKLIKKNQFKGFIKNISSIINQIDNLVKISKKSISIPKTVVEGIRLTHNILEKNLKTWHIKKINQVNIPFNPNIHILEKNKKTDTNTDNIKIKKIKKNGYTFKNHVIKKAVVVI